MVTAPILMPVAFGWVVGVVCPAAMLTVVGEKVSLERSLLVSVTVTPPAGAGVPNVTGKSTEVLRPTFKFDGTVIAPGGVTVTPAVALAILGVVVLAVIWERAVSALIQTHLGQIVPCRSKCASQSLRWVFSRVIACHPTRTIVFIPPRHISTLRACAPPSAAAPRPAARACR